MIVKEIDTSKRKDVIVQLPRWIMKHWDCKKVTMRYANDTIIIEPSERGQDSGRRNEVAKTATEFETFAHMRYVQ